MTVVLDCSAMLAVLFEEPGADIVLDHLEQAVISTVNLGEATAKLAERDVPPARVVDFIDRSGVEVADFRLDDALEAGALRPATKRFGLSFGDRACLALAMRRQCTIITSDAAFARIDLPVSIELIR